MAYHFSANQYEDKYSPRKLGNWEYPKWYPDRPRQRFKSTKIIADDQGRLLAGIKRENAWGNYVGTWDLPKRITRDYVRKLVAPPERLLKLWQEDGTRPKPTAYSKCEDQKSAEKQKTETLPESLPALTYVSESGKSFEKRNRSSSALDLRPQVTKLEPLQNLQKTASPQAVKSTALDEKIKSILDSIEAKGCKKDNYPKDYCKQVDAFPPHYKQKPDFIDSPLKDKYNDNDGYLNSLEEHIEKYDKRGDGIEQESQPELMALEKLKMEGLHSEALTQEDPPNNQLDNLRHQSIAKRYHEQNLRHKPLPDVIDDPVYRALLDGKNSQSDQLLNLEGMPSAIGWKNYSVPGPTECSKLKVYRPKTALEKGLPLLPRDERPKTTGGNQKPKNKWLPIDLAICWDLAPEDSSEEPITNSQIDGNNASAAPAVFAMIHPRDTGGQPNFLCPTASCQAVAEKIPSTIAPDNLANLPSQTNGKTPTPKPCNVNKEAIMACIKSELNPSKISLSQSPTSTNSISTNAANFARKNPQTPWSNQDTSKALSTKLLHLQRATSNADASNNRTNSRNNSQLPLPKKHHQSTPNLPSACDDTHCPNLTSPPPQPSLSSKSRQCSSAKLTYNHQNPNLQKPAPKPRNRSACEKPNSYETCERQVFKPAFKAGVPNSESSNSGSTTAAKSYKVPKMRLPYAKKTYSIGTLVPPFSFWPESNGQEYPDHWRLASVYQHSYKPLNTRKRPMLASVYQ